MAEKITVMLEYNPEEEGKIMPVEMTMTELIESDPYLRGYCDGVLEQKWVKRGQDIIKPEVCYICKKEFNKYSRLYRKIDGVLRILCGTCIKLEK